jgi:toxin ParE1/3/4
VDRLGQYPFYGRAAAWDSRGLLRELPVAGTPFVVVYEVNETVGAVVVLRVVHGAQRRGLE